MINRLYSSSQHLTVTGGSMPYIHHGQTSAGMVRYNPTVNRMEVYDGMSWINLDHDVQVDLSQETKELLEWARSKRDEERRWRTMIETNPAIRDAYQHYKQAEEQLRIVDALAREE